MKKLFLICLSFFLFASPAEAQKKTNSSIKSVTKKSAKKSKSKKGSLSFESLVKTAEETKSGSLIITQDGKFLVENNWESPLSFYYLQGITASVMTLALGSLMDEGKLQLESGLAQWIPEWLDNRSQIKVQHLLNHTSGFADDEREPWYKSSDTWTWAKSQTTKTTPGTEFNLSDTNFLLLGFVISKATESDPENLVKKRLFEPLKIQKWGWDKDKFGQSNTAGGLRIRNYDVLKIGNLMANDGKWNNQKIISQVWLDHISKPSEKSPIYSLGWWLQEEKGVKAIYAHGYQGQFLVIVPEKKLVALRLRTLVPVEQNKPEHDWNDFPKDLLELVSRN